MAGPGHLGLDVGVQVGDDAVDVPQHARHILVHVEHAVAGVVVGVVHLRRQRGLADAGGIACLHLIIALQQEGLQGRAWRPAVSHGMG